MRNTIETILITLLLCAFVFGGYVLYQHDKQLEAQKQINVLLLEDYILRGIEKRQEKNGFENFLMPGFDFLEDLELDKEDVI